MYSPKAVVACSAESPMFIVTWYETVYRPKSSPRSAAALRSAVICSATSSGCMARQQVIQPSPYLITRAQESRILRLATSGARSPVSLMLETTQVGGGCWTGISGPISVPDQNETSSKS